MTEQDLKYYALVLALRMPTAFANPMYGAMQGPQYRYKSAQEVVQDAQIFLAYMQSKKSPHKR